MIRLVNESRGGVLLADQVRVADGFAARARGWLGHRPRPGEGLVLIPCRAIHSWFMRGPIDVAFVDASGRILHAIHRLPPFRSARRPGARCVVELAPGILEATGTQVGDRLGLYRGMFRLPYF